MSKKLFLLIGLLIMSVSANAQILHPAEWTIGLSETKVKVGDEVDLVFSIQIEDDWYLYSSDFDPELGPKVTAFEFEANDSYELVGGVIPINPKKAYDEIYEGDYTYFVGQGQFRQRIKILKESIAINGLRDYQVCTNVDGKCIPFEEDFSISFEAIAAPQPKKEIPEELPKLEKVEDRAAPSIGLIEASEMPEEQNDMVVEPNWKFLYEGDLDDVGTQVNLVFNAEIPKDWYMYSTDFDPELGPVVTEFDFNTYSALELQGGVKAIDRKEAYDEIFEGDYTYFEKQAKFVQVVKVLEGNSNFDGIIRYQICSKVDGKCVLFETEFNDQDFVQSSESAKLISLPNQDKSSLLPVNGEVEEASIWLFLMTCFGAGLLALITPCVFPMVPMTVSFFTGDKNGITKAMFYGLSIVAIFVVFGTVVAFFNGPEFANWLSTHWFPNLLFFAIFVFFALSFLGWFDLTLPSSWVNNADAQADKGGYYGVFFMAFTLVLVSFSCTGPIVGSLLVESAGGQFFKPVLGMLAFGLAIAIPFTLFAVFPNWLSKLPQSGGWLNSVKVVLGFLELALALKFLSVADQVYHWGILDRDVFLVILISIFSLLGFYLLGKIRLPHDSPLERITVPRLLLAITTFSFVVYLIPGLIGAPLKSLSGFLPPMTSHDFNLMSASNQQVSMENEDYTLCSDAKYSDFLHLPHEIKGYFDYEEAIACAREQNKPLFIDFTGHGCTNCRQMEANVWSDPAVLKMLKDDFVVVALYIDEKKELSEDKWITSSYDQKIKKSIGSINADFQITRYQNNAQPFYVILDENEELLAQPKAYDLDVANFISFLKGAKESYRKSAAS